MASQEIGSLFVALGLDSAVFTAGAKQVAGQTSKLQRGLQNFAGRAQALGAKLSIVSGAMAAVGTAAYVLVKDVAAAGDGIAKTARGAGVSGEYLQEMTYALGQVAAVSQGELASGLTRVNKMLGEAQAGSKSATATLERLGFTQQQIASGTITTEQAFDAYVTKVSEMTSASDAAALSAAVLGKSGADLGGKLMGTAGTVNSLRDRARELGIVMSDRGLAASEAFGDAMDDVGKGFEGLRITIADKLLPVFVETLLPAINERVIPALQELVGHVAGVIEWFTELPAPIQEAAGVVAAALGAGGPILLAVSVLSRGFAKLLGTGPIGLFIGAAVLAVTAWQVWGDDIKAAIAPVIEWISTTFTKIKDFLTENGRTILLAITGPIGLSILAWERWGTDIMTAVSSAWETVKQVFVDGWDAIIEYMKTLPSKFLEIGGQIIDGLKAGLAAKWDSLVSWFTGKGDELTEDFKENYDINSPSRVFREIGQFITQGLGLGLQDGIPEVKAAMSEVSDAVGGAGVGEPAYEMRDAFSKAFADVALQGKSLGQSLRQSLSSWLGQKASSLFTSGFNGLWGALKLPTFASGTNNFAGGLAVVNERGGEIMNLPGGTQIIPHDISKRMADRSGGMGGLNVTVTMDPSTGALGAFVRNEAGAILAQAAPVIVGQSVRATYERAREYPMPGRR